jgi:cystathionine beta-lyase
MVSFYLAPGLSSSTFLGHLKVFTLAESLGGVESLAELPVSMTHAGVPEDRRRELGIDESLIRLSVGIEEKEDLVRDLEEAFKFVVQEKEGRV